MSARDAWTESGEGGQALTDGRYRDAVGHYGNMLLVTLGAVFMYGFGRAMGFRPFAAAVAGVAFTYGSFLTTQMHHANILQTAIWLPLVNAAVAVRAKHR